MLWACVDWSSLWYSQVEAQLQDRVFRDEVDWDLSDPQNTPHKYASAVCYDLGLGWEAAAAIAAAVEEQLRVTHEVCTNMLSVRVLSDMDRSCQLCLGSFR